jgi:hypothetical protein
MPRELDTRPPLPLRSATANQVPATEGRASRGPGVERIAVALRVPIGPAPPRHPAQPAQSSRARLLVGA